MRIEETRLSGVCLLRPSAMPEARGPSQARWNEGRLPEASLARRFPREIRSLTRLPGTVHGLQYQAPPFEQERLVWVSSGEILSVAVDVRRGSPSFGQWVRATLSPTNGRQMLIPGGFLHGFITRALDTTVIIKVTRAYSAQADGRIHFADPDIGIDWGLPPERIVATAKDRAAPALRAWRSPFQLPSLAA
ncbi:MAG: dTDP-4-dehydrorhamnose 3,5-epimerase family protein [Pseudomonadota bacterium]